MLILDYVLFAPFDSKVSLGTVHKGKGYGDEYSALITSPVLEPPLFASDLLGLHNPVLPVRHRH